VSERRFNPLDPLGLFPRNRNSTALESPGEAEFIAKIRKNIPDEAMAHSEYADMALAADRLGHPWVHQTLRQMSEDEGRHKKNLEEMLRRLT